MFERGIVKNILFSNFLLHGPSIAAQITQNSGNNGSYSGSSLMEISDVTFSKFTGYTTGGKGNRTAAVSCSTVKPCFDILFDNFEVASEENGTEFGAQGTCSYIQKGGVVGLEGAGC
jgi:galacturan 1,4-alpha-galacturonidase